MKLISYFGRGSKSSMLESIERAISTLEGRVTGWLKSKIQPVVCRKDHLSDRSKVSREIPGAIPSRESRRSAAPVFSERGPAPDYSTAIEARRRATRPIWRSLYGLYLLGLQSLVSVKATDTGLRNLKTLADNRLGESQSGFLFIRILSHLLMGVACSCDLSHGSQCSRISQSCNAMPTRLRNGRMVSQLIHWRPYA